VRNSAIPRKRQETSRRRSLAWCAVAITRWFEVMPRRWVYGLSPLTSPPIVKG